jgi:CMP/dCMP kinase
VHHPVVTIERMVACGGLYIGRLVAQELGVPCLDQEFLAAAVRPQQQEVGSLPSGEGRLSFGRRLLAAFSSGSPESDYLPPPFPFPEEAALFASQQSVITEKVRVSGGVVIGHGGAAILAGHPGVLSVFCHAPLEERARRLLQLYQVSGAHEATREIEAQDRARERYLEAVTGRYWRDPGGYHLCVDTAAIGLDQAAQLIVHQVGLRLAGLQGI